MNIGENINLLNSINTPFLDEFRTTKYYHIVYFITKKDDKTILFSDAIKYARADKGLTIFKEKTTFFKFIENFKKLHEYELHIFCTNDITQKETRKEIESFYCTSKKTLEESKKNKKLISKFTKLSVFTLLLTFFSIILLLVLKLYLVSLGFIYSSINIEALIDSILWIPALVFGFFCLILIGIVLTFPVSYLLKEKLLWEPTKKIKNSFSIMIALVIVIGFLDFLYVQILDIDRDIYIYIYLAILVIILGIFQYWLTRGQIACIVENTLENIKWTKIFIIFVYGLITLYFIMILSLNYFKNISLITAVDNNTSKDANITKHICEEIKMVHPELHDIFLDKYIEMSITPKPVVIKRINSDKNESILYMGTANNILYYYPNSTMKVIINSKEENYNEFCKKNVFYPNSVISLLQSGELKKFRKDEIASQKIDSMENTTFYKAFCVDINRTNWGCNE